MGSFSFNTSDGKTFDIKGPEGLSLAQAKAIFDQQVSTGSLVGFKPGDVLSAATQAAKGLPGAQAALQQGLSGLNASLGKVTSSLSSSIGSISKTLGDAGGALGGKLSSTAAGLSGEIGPAISKITGAVNSAASTSIATINKAITTLPVTSPIDTLNFVKELPALSSIGPMAQTTVTGVLAQSKQLVGQASAAISNDKGVGSFGLNVQQLENAGFVKPGTSGLVTSGVNTLTSVLKSPTTFTGKDGISSLTSLLSSPSAQSKIQQSLMKTGLAGLGAAGLPISSLSAQGAAGMALNASKSLPDATAYLKGLPIPGDPTGAVKAAFDTNVRDGAFAAKLAETKIPTEFKAEVVPVPAADTVNRLTVDAASQRIAGNPKIPEPNYGPPMVADSNTQAVKIQTGIKTVVEEANKRAIFLANLGERVSVLENQATIPAAAYEDIKNQYAADREDYNSRVQPLIASVLQNYETATSVVRTVLAADIKTLNSGLTTLIERSKTLRERISQLARKVTTT